MRVSLLAILALILAMSFHPVRSQEGEPAVLERARDSRKQAEQELAEFRRRRLEERREMAAELNAAYDDVDVARRELRALRAEVERLRSDLEEDPEEVEQEAAQALQRAASGLGLSVGADSDIATAEAELQERLEGRIAELERGMELRAETAQVLSRDGRPVEVTVLHLGAYAAYACGADANTCGILHTAGEQALPQISGPVLPEPAADALRRSASSAGDRVPVDVDGSLRTQAPRRPTTLQSWLRQGGVFVYPILAVAALGLLIVLERLFHLLRTGTRQDAVDSALDALARGDCEEAWDALAGVSTPTGRVLRAAAKACGRSETQREAEMESALMKEEPHLERGLSLLAALAGVAPLLGLLGTVSGMVSTFNVISRTGTADPKLLSGGISEALITTELGLIVAVPLLLTYAALRSWVHRREAMLEYAAIRGFGIREEEGG